MNGPIELARDYVAKRACLLRCSYANILRLVVKKKMHGKGGVTGHRSDFLFLHLSF